MNKNNIIKEVENRVGKNDIKTSLELLYSFFREVNAVSLSDSTVIILGTFNNLHDQYNKGLISYQEFQISESQIRSRVLYFKNQIGDLITDEKVDINFNVQSSDDESSQIHIDLIDYYKKEAEKRKEYLKMRFYDKNWLNFILGFNVPVYQLKLLTETKKYKRNTVFTIVTSNCVIGRDSKCTIVLDYMTITRRHLEIVNTYKEYKINILSASNPVLIKGVPISSTYHLKNNDILSISMEGAELQFICDPPILTSKLPIQERIQILNEQVSNKWKYLFKITMFFIVVMIVMVSLKK